MKKFFKKCKSHNNDMSYVKFYYVVKIITKIVLSNDEIEKTGITNLIIAKKNS